MSENGLLEQNAPQSRRRTRRQLLYGGAAAVGVVAAEALGRAVPASAANGDPILMGQSNQASQGTSIIDNGGDTTFSATSSGNGIALEGISANGPGVLGTSTNGMGVVGTTLSTASNAAAVYGEVFTTHPGSLSAAVRGQNDGVGSDGVGVYGSHLGDGLGVFGTTVGGTGVFGTASTGTGVEGSGETGVFGVSTSRHGAGVVAQNNNGGLALQVEGVAAFSRSGVATVPAGQAQVTHRLPLGSASFVLATIQGNVSGLYVRGVTIATGSHASFTIHLSKTVKSKTRVAWLAVN